MSADNVDDLHQAEDLLGQHNLLRGYCRPTCGAEGAGRDECESDEDCGCPCHDATEDSGSTTETVVVTVDDEGDAVFACPKCGSGRIVGQDTGIRWSDVHRAKLIDGVLLITFAQNDAGEFEGDGYLCRDCGTVVVFPYEVEEDYV